MLYALVHVLVHDVLRTHVPLHQAYVKQQSASAQEAERRAQAAERERAEAAARSEELSARLEAALLRLAEVERREAEAKQREGAAEVERRKAESEKREGAAEAGGAAIADVSALVEVWGVALRGASRHPAYSIPQPPLRANPSLIQSSFPFALHYALRVSLHLRSTSFHNANGRLTGPA